MACTVHLRSDLLDNRLDAVYYSPSFLANHERLIRSKIGRAPLQKLIMKGRRAVYFSTDTLDFENAPPSWVPFLTADDLSADGCFVELNAQKRVSPEFASRYPNGLLRSNELLVKVKGPNQTTAYNEQKTPRDVLVSGTIWGALVRTDTIDPYYLVAALSCQYSATARNRLRTNTNVEFLSAEDLLQLLVPVPVSRTVERYIGNQLRRAKALKELGMRNQNRARDFFEKFQPESKLEINEKSFRAATGNLSEMRLDSNFYHPRFISIDSKLRSLGCKPISEFATLPNDSWDHREKSICYYEIGDVEISTGLIHGKEVALESAPASAQKLIKTWDVLVATVRPNRKNVGIVLPDGDPLRKVGSSAFTILRFHNQLDACIYHAWLRTDAGTEQLIRWNAGSTYPTIDRIVPGIVLAPNISEEEHNQLGFTCQAGILAFDLSRALKSTAKILVDALIEGIVTEAELIAVQEALERGDTSADRALLSRLTRQGIDVPGQPPLFADLDRLYALLHEVNQFKAE